MSKKCKGCGAILQQEHKEAIGYTPKAEAAYCQRCFRITHYDDVVISMKQGVDGDAVLRKIADMDALILWVVDVYDFEANLIKGLNRHLMGKDVIMVATKRDLLPNTLGNQKLSNFLLARLKAVQIQVQGIVICGDLATHPKRDENDSIEEIFHAIEHFRNGRDVVVMGTANAGKSTLLNALCENNALTTSRHPGTTLDFNEIEMDGYCLYDTPGITRMDSLLTHVDDRLLKTVIPLKPLKARNYQLYEDQSLAIGGLVRLDIIGCQDVSCVCYFSERLKVHRGKQAKANQLWSEHLGELLSPSMCTNFTEMKVFELHNIKDKMDVVIHGLGWFCISGQVDEVKVYVPKEGSVTFRKAMM